MRAVGRCAAGRRTRRVLAGSRACDGDVPAIGGSGTEWPDSNGISLRQLPEELIFLEEARSRSAVHTLAPGPSRR